MKNGFLIAVTLLVALFVNPALAGVNTKNGNFYISYTDIDSELNGTQFSLVRTYNSKSTQVGWFGFGWGTPLETYISVMPDYSVVIYEGGGNGREFYLPPKDASGLKAGVERIVSVAIERDHLDAAAANALRDKLLVDEVQRRLSVKKYGIQTQLPVGAVAGGSQCEEITRLQAVYQRKSCSAGVPSTDTFDLAGRLLSKQSGESLITLHYSGNYPDQIEDSSGQKIFLQWTPEGRIASQSASHSTISATYTYDANNNFTFAKHSSHNYYVHSYDANHHLTQVRYADGSHLDITYDANNLVTSVTEPNGEKTTYAYRHDPANPDRHYWTKVTLLNKEGQPQASYEDEYLLANDAAGVEYIASVNRHREQQTNAREWDERGRLKRVDRGDGFITEYFYHPTLNKLTQVKTPNEQTDFEYNAAGDLILAKASYGPIIKLDYDRKKHIRRIVETHRLKAYRRELTFSYNTSGKLIKVALKGKGEMHIEYDAAGEVSNVSSTQGVSVAMSVSAIFQTVLATLSVAGIQF